VLAVPLLRTLVAIFALTVIVNYTVSMAKCSLRYLNLSRTISMRDSARVYDNAWQIAQRYPGQNLQIGSGTGSGAWIFNCPSGMLMAQGNEPLVNLGTVDDYFLAGYPLPQSTLDALAAGHVKVFLIPVNQIPFATRSIYAYDALCYPEEFRRVFAAHFDHVESTDIYDVYTWHEGSKSPKPILNSPGDPVD
jgi:hypothetical protein